MAVNTVVNFLSGELRVAFRARLAWGGRVVSKRVPSAKADSILSLCFPGTYVPGYLDAAAARLVRGYS